MLPKKYVCFCLCVVVGSMQVEMFSYFPVREVPEISPGQTVESVRSQKGFSRAANV